MGKKSQTYLLTNCYLSHLVAGTHLSSWRLPWTKSSCSVRSLSCFLLLSLALLSFLMKMECRLGAKPGDWQKTISTTGATVSSRWPGTEKKLSNCKIVYRGNRQFSVAMCNQFLFETFLGRLLPLGPSWSWLGAMGRDTQTQMPFGMIVLGERLLEM